MSENVFELEPDSSFADRKELTRRIPVLENFLKKQFGFDFEKAKAEFEAERKRYFEKKAEAQKKRESELKELEATAERESYRLLFSHFKPLVNGEEVDWKFRFKTNEYETVTIEEAVKEKTNVFVSRVALTEPMKHLNDIEKAVAGVEFLIRRKDSGTFYNFPTFKVKRVR